MTGQNWTCSYCGQPTTITDPNWSYTITEIETHRSKHNRLNLVAAAIACPNPNCEELDLRVTLHKREWHNGKLRVEQDNIVADFRLLPRSKAKPQPEYIPKAIRDDYYEACFIANDSPKAAAALARRCLQGIVRDFWEIPMGKRGNLGAELSQIKENVTDDTWEAIQSVRSVGDIGAHMEKDVNLIIEVEPEEAELLLELIETLFSDWYVARHKRTERNKRLIEVASSKLAQKKSAKLEGKMKDAHAEQDG